MTPQYYARNTGRYLLQGALRKAAKRWALRLPQMPKAYKAKWHGHTINVLHTAETLRIEGHALGEWVQSMPETLALEIMRQARQEGVGLWIGKYCSWDEVWRAYCDIGAK